MRCAHHTHIGDRERATLVLLRLELTITGLLGQFLAHPADVRQTQSTTVADNRRNQAIRGGHSHANVLRVVLTDEVTVPRRVRSWHLPKRNCGSFNDKIVHRELGVLGFLGVTVRSLCRCTVEQLTELQNAVHFNIKRDIVVRQRCFALRQTLSNRAAHVRDRLIRVRWTSSSLRRRSTGSGSTGTRRILLDIFFQNATLRTRALDLQQRNTTLQSDALGHRSGENMVKRLAT